MSGQACHRLADALRSIGPRAARLLTQTRPHALKGKAVTASSRLFRSLRLLHNRQLAVLVYPPPAPRWGGIIARAPSYRLKLEKRRQELKDELEALEGDLAIIRSLRNSDCVQGANRQGLYSFIEKVLGDDKDGQYLIEYLRCNMRVAEMPLLKVTTVQAIRRRVTHGFEKLNKRLEEIYAVEGWDILRYYEFLCARILRAAPPAPRKTGPKPKPTPQSDFKKAVEALDRIEAALAQNPHEQ